MKTPKPIKTPKRALDEIAEKIHQAERKNIFEIGAWLLEARDLCERERRKHEPDESRGWGEWLHDEFDWSEDTAARQMKVAKLASRFRKLRNLKLAKSTLYELVEEDEADQPAIIAELARHATRRRLRPAEASNIIIIGRARGRHGDYPDATLKEIDWLERSSIEAWAPQAIEELKAKKPETKVAVEEIVAVFRDHEDDHPTDQEDGADQDEQPSESDDDDHREAEQTLNDSPPVLPPTPPPSDESDHARSLQRNQFREVVEKIAVLSTKLMATYDNAVPQNELIKAADFFNAVAKRKPADSDEQRTDYRKLEMELYDLRQKNNELEDEIKVARARIAELEGSAPTAAAEPATDSAPTAVPPDLSVPPILKRT